MLVCKFFFSNIERTMNQLVSANFCFYMLLNPFIGVKIVLAMPFIVSNFYKSKSLVLASFYPRALARVKSDKKK